MAKDYKIWITLEVHNDEAAGYEEEYEDLSLASISLYENGCLGNALIELLDMADAVPLEAKLRELYS